MPGRRPSRSNVGATGLVEILGHVAVGTQDLNLRWVAMISKPEQEPVSATTTPVTSVQMDALPHATTLNMIKDQERSLRLATATAFAPICSQRHISERSIPVSSDPVAMVSVLFSVLFDLLWVQSRVGPLCLALTGLAPTVPWSIEPRLRPLNLASCTLPHMSKLTEWEAWTRALEIERG
jgi:hypothetical protein